MTVKIYKHQEFHVRNLHYIRGRRVDVGYKSCKVCRLFSCHHLVLFVLGAQFVNKLIFENNNPYYIVTMKFLLALLSTMAAVAMAAPSSEAPEMNLLEKRCLGAGGMSLYS